MPTFSDTLIRTSKMLYEEQYQLNTANQFWKRIFSEQDDDLSAGFILDTLIGSPYAIRYRQKDGQSYIRKYEPGSGSIIEPPIASEKTKIDQTLRDKVTVGIESTASFNSHDIAKVDKIIKQHISAINMTKNYQAINLLRDGVFYARGQQSASLTGDIGLDIDYSRDSGLNLTYDFTAGGATITKALIEAQNKLREFGTPYQDMVAIMGDNWLNEYSTDSDIQSYMQNNNANVINATNMTPPELLNIEGLRIVAQYRGPGMKAPIWLCTYTPPILYTSYEGATASEWVADNDAIFFTLPDRRVNVNRGIDVLDGNERQTRDVGDTIFDQYTEKDPVGLFLRSNVRNAFVLANKNHTARSVGTFS